MAGYIVRLTRQPERYLQNAGTMLRDRLDRALAQLCENPQAPGCTALLGKLKGSWRKRVGAWRIIYQIDEAARSVTVEWIGPRGDVYK